MDKDGLLGLLAKAYYLKKSSNGFALLERLDHAPFCTMTHKTLDAIDSRFVPVIEHHLSLIPREDGSHMATWSLMHAIHNWDERVDIVFPESVAIDNNQPYRFIRLTNVTRRTDMPEHVYLRLRFYALALTPCGISYAYQINEQPFRCSKASLDDVYPGWYDRFHLIKTLDASMLTMTQYVFGKPVFHPVADISGITFD